MYTGSAPNMKAHTKELLLAADKYNMQDLMGMCKNELRESLTPASVAEVLLVANMIRECDITLYVGPNLFYLHCFKESLDIIIIPRGGSAGGSHFTPLITDQSLCNMGYTLNKGQLVHFAKFRMHTR